MVSGRPNLRGGTLHAADDPTLHDRPDGQKCPVGKLKQMNRARQCSDSANESKARQGLPEFCECRRPADQGSIAPSDMKACHGIAFAQIRAHHALIWNATDVDPRDTVPAGPALIEADLRRAHRTTSVEIHREPARCSIVGQVSFRSSFSLDGIGQRPCIGGIAGGKEHARHTSSARAGFAVNLG